MKALILLEDGYQTLEFWYPYLRLKEEGVEVVVAAPEKKEYASKRGYPATADVSIADVDAIGFDCLLIPGGKAPARLRENTTVLEKTKAFSEAGKPIAAICHGAQVLISAGLVEGKRMACWPGIKEELESAGGIFADEEAVVDGSYITSRKPDDLPAFMKKVLSSISA